MNGIGLTARGGLLLSAGRTKEAIDVLQQALKQNDPDAAYLLGQAWFTLKDYTKSAKAYRQAITLDPNHDAAANNLLHALSGQQRYGDLLSHAESMLRKNPWDVAALAFKCIALAELGSAENESALADLEHLVMAQRIETPPGYSDLDTFNRALANALANEPSLVREPAEHATRAGWHSGNLAKSPSSAIQALNAMIRSKVDARIAATPPADHPFAKAKPKAYDYRCWTVIMDEAGHQLPHIHDHGWLSGVYYVEIPAEISETDPSRHGWLSLGRSEERWHRPTTRTVERMICPQAGLMVTFPSYVWHGTRPLRSKQRRISYAFDIIPT